MFVRRELTGVFQVEDRLRNRNFSADERIVVQHLANQVGLALELQEQKFIREQLFRSEKLAAIGKFVSAIASELRAPLTSICRLSSPPPAGTSTAGIGKDMALISAEAKRASEIVSRLTSFTGSEGSVKPIDVQSLLQGLVKFRAQEWKARGIAVRNLLDNPPIIVLGSEGQLEKVFLDLLVQVEQSLANAAEKVITLQARTLAKRALIEVSFPHPADPEGIGMLESFDQEPGSVELQVLRSVIAGHSGEFRIIRGDRADMALQIELPLAPERELVVDTPAHPHGGRKRTLTAMLLGAGSALARELVVSLSARGYRVVPVSNPDEGIDLVQRMPFDLVFCPTTLQGANWLDVQRRMASRAGAFVLLTDGNSGERALDISPEGFFELAKPDDESALVAVLNAVESHLAGRPPVEKLV